MATNTPAEAIDFIVCKKEIHLTQIVPGQKPGDPPLKPGQARIHVDKFAFTSNNISYAAFGEALSYWKFFPVAKEGWGRVPVWGFGDVVESHNDAVKMGERLYGYFPMSTYLTIDADRLTATTLIDSAPHRADLPPVYNQYARVSADPAHVRETEGLYALIRPLCLTSFLLDDFFAENAFFGAKQIILSSASSKTAASLAFFLSKARKDSVEIIGLTSPQNTPFTKSLGYYDRVLAYGDVRELDEKKPAVLVDFSGDAGVFRSVHTHFGDALKYSCQVGATHWKELAELPDLPGPKPTFFFAPAHVSSRLQSWGAAAFQSRTAGALRGFMDVAPKWLRVVENRGPKAVEAVYQSVLNGEANPAEGHVLSL